MAPGRLAEAGGNAARSGADPPDRRRGYRMGVRGARLRCPHEQLRSSGRTLGGQGASEPSRRRGNRRRSDRRTGQVEPEQPALGRRQHQSKEQEVFRRLLRLLELPPVLASTLADWLDADSETSPDGAEDAYYLTLSPPYRSANRPLSDVDDLLRVRGFDAAVVERLRAHVTALPGYDRVNVNTASCNGARRPRPGPVAERSAAADRSCGKTSHSGISATFARACPDRRLPRTRRSSTRAAVIFSVCIRARYERTAVVHRSAA